MRPSVLLAIFACATSWLWQAAGSASAADAVSDYDKRAAATLYKTYDGKEMDWERVTPEQIKGLTRVEKSADGKKLEYVMNFGAATAGGDNRGYFKITKGEELPDATKAGWILHKNDPATGGEFFYKKIEAASGKYTNVAIRRKIGPVILTIAQRRPFDESLDTSMKELTTRFEQFIETARKNGIFGGEVKMWLTSVASQPQISGGNPLTFTLDDGNEKNMDIRIEVHDSDDKPMNNVKRLVIELVGSFAPLVKLKYQDKVLTPVRGKYVIDDPGLVCNVTLVLPAGGTDAVEDVLYGDLDASKSGSAAVPGLELNVGAQLGK